MGETTKKSLFDVIGTLKNNWKNVETIVAAIVDKLPAENSAEAKKWNGAYIIRKNCDQWKNTFKKLENASIKKCDPAIKKLLNALIQPDVNIDFVGSLTVQGMKGKNKNNKTIKGTPAQILSELQRDTQSESTITKTVNNAQKAAKTKHPAHYVLPMLEEMEKAAKNYVTTALKEVNGLTDSETGLQDCLLSIKYLRRLLVDLK